MATMKDRKKRQVSSEGKFIKKALIELNMSQKEFCREYNVPESRLSDIIHMDGSSRRMLPWRLKVYDTLKRLLKENVG